MNKQKIKRRNFLIAPKFQLKVVKETMVMSMMVVIVSTLGLLLVLSLGKNEISQPDPFSTHNAVTMAPMPDLMWMFTHLWPYFLLALLLTAIVSMLFGIFKSFRVAGPEYRMVQILKAIKEGDFSHEERLLRKHDELQQLYKGITEVHTAYKSNIEKLQEIYYLKNSSEMRLEKIKEIIFSFKLKEEQ
ncbi:MAG: hypothetical protein Q9M31_02500 [Mariprofundus sp.]|nr:hypothetical protein [Mariprofundus sp.]